MRMFEAIEVLLDHALRLVFAIQLGCDSHVIARFNRREGHEGVVPTAAFELRVALRQSEQC
jgi:hypothetical protein